MKLGVSYSVFSGIELLEYSIKQIRSEVDFIAVSYQEEDWFEINKLTEKNYNILKKLEKDGLINYLWNFKIYKSAVNPIQAKLLEKEKRNLGRKICFNNGCDYFLDCDVDEFYITEEFKKAKNFLINNNYKYSYCSFINYFKKPIYRCKQISDAFVPFICYLDINKDLGPNSLSIIIDGTRSYCLRPEEKYYIFKSKELLMHHLSMVRKNLKEKYISTSQAVLNRNNIDNIVNKTNNITEDNLMFDNIQLEIVNNIFNIPMEL